MNNGLVEGGGRGLLKSLPIGPVNISRTIMFLKTHGYISLKLGLFDQSGLRPNPPPQNKKKRERERERERKKSLFRTTHDSDVFMDSKNYCVIVHGQQKLLCYCSHGQQKAQKNKKKGCRSSSKIYDFF